MTAEEWFGGDGPRSEDEARFLARLREAAPRWAEFGVGPEGTGCRSVLVPLFLEVAVPALAGSKGIHSLHLGYWPDGCAPRLLGEWGDDHLLDNGGNAGDLQADRAGSPEEFAEIAAGWIESQLRRPIVRREWLRGTRTRSIEVVVEGGGPTISGRGSWLARRRQPDLTVLIT